MSEPIKSTTTGQPAATAAVAGAAHGSASTALQAVLSEFGDPRVTYLGPAHNHQTIVVVKGSDYEKLLQERGWKLVTPNRQS